MKILILSDFLPDHKLILSEEFRKMLVMADAIVLNLEGSPQLPQTAENLPTQIMPFNVKNFIEFISAFGKEKFHIALANNHILDNGIKAFDWMIKEFDENKIHYFGTNTKPYTIINNIAFLNVVTAETVAKRKKGESRLSYLFYNTDNLNRLIKSVEKKYDKLVFYPHWGRDMDTTVFETYKKKIKFGKKWYTFGHHPHVISGIQKNNIYSMGNNYIPHPYYFDMYPATHYGLAILLDQQSMQYELYKTILSKKDNKYKIDISNFVEIDREVLDHGRDYGKVKKMFLKIFAFQGNPTDLLKLKILQALTIAFEYKYKLMKK